LSLRHRLCPFSFPVPISQGLFKRVMSILGEDWLLESVVVEHLNTGKAYAHVYNFW
jgi:hypothetical protein